MKADTFLLSAALATGLLVAPGLHAQEQSGKVAEVEAMIGLADGANPRGFIQRSTPQGITFSTTPGGSGRQIAYQQIRGEGASKAVRFQERAEALGPARALFADEQYEKAAEAFGKVARNYAVILFVPGNFALEAFFFEAESLRRSGQYEKLAELMDLTVADTMNTLLGERYQDSVEFLELWGLYGSGNMEALDSALAVYQEPVVGDDSLLGVPKFKKMPASELAQIAFLRAEVMFGKGEKVRALDDYYRAFTVGYGNDPSLARLAMLQAMRLHAEDPASVREGGAVESHLQSLAYLYSRRFGTGGLDPELQDYIVRPEMKPLQTAGGGDSEAASEGDGEGEENAAETTSGEEGDE